MKKGKRKPCWNHFFVSKDDPHPQNPHVTCKYCSKEFKRGIPERMQAHLDNCDEAPENAKAQFNNDSMSETEQNSLEILLVKALSSAKVDSSFVENPSVIKLFQQLRPSFKLPNRKKFNQLELIIGYQQETDTYSNTQTKPNPNYQSHTQQIDFQQEAESNQFHTQQIDYSIHQQQAESNSIYQVHTELPNLAYHFKF
ncbi:unnamed protein product [Rhizophagus irregularis]|uniref:BED-type domain-containing protein n=2 Tax=Rhizophagus irregularis TaxID=588596 RepID=A0A915Z0F3_9GLOM|nr:unnamed protein product [Rhizophagus irregularis]CAB5191699.1 unnamed protein product [Rhizophagus irregularis]CAB5356586.1 unnamed protein product [Rhizophagus irregularis]